MQKQEEVEVTIYRQQLLPKFNPHHKYDIIVSINSNFTITYALYIQSADLVHRRTGLRYLCQFISGSQIFEASAYCIFYTFWV